MKLPRIEVKLVELICKGCNGIWYVEWAIPRPNYCPWCGMKIKTWGGWNRGQERGIGEDDENLKS